MASRRFDYKIRRFMVLKPSGIALAVLVASPLPSAAQTRPFLTEEATTAPEVK